MNFGKNLKEARQNAGITQVELAEMVGIDKSAVSFFERGTKIPNIMTAVAIAKVLHVPIGELTKE